mgnify:FL=1
MMEDKNKILEQLKDAPPLWRYCNVINKEACFAGNQYKTPYTLQEVLEKDGNGVGVLLGKHSGGLAAVDFDGTGSDINFKHHVGIHPKHLPKTVSVASGRKDRKQMFFWIPDEYMDLLARKEKKLDGCGKFELRYGDNYSMVAGVHPETNGYFWLPGCSPSEIGIADAPLFLLEYWAKQCKEKTSYISVKRPQEDLIFDSGRVEDYLSKYFVPANNYSDYETWITVGMALHYLSKEWEEFNGIEDKHLKDWNNWSYKMDNFDPVELQKKWSSFSKKPGGIQFGSFVHLAKKHPQYIKDHPETTSFNKVPGGTKVPEGTQEKKRKRSELLKDLLQHAKNKDKDSFYEDFAEYEHRYKRKPSLVNNDILHELRDSYAQKVFTSGEIDMSLVEDLEYLLEGYLIKGEVQQIFAGPGMGKTSLLAGMIKAGYHGIGFLNQTRHRPKFRTLWISCDGGASRWKATYDELGLTPEMVDTIGGDIKQAKTPWKWIIPDIVQLIEDHLKKKEYGLVVFDSLKGMMANSGFSYCDNEHSDSIVQFMREIIAEPFGLACVLINHMGTDNKSASGAKRWGEAVAMNMEIKPVMEKIEDGKEREENHGLRKLCIWKNPIEGRDFLDYKLEDGIFVPAYNRHPKGDCYNDMKDFVQKINFETGQKVFTRKDLLKLPNYSDVQKQRVMKEHLKSKFGIFKEQKDSNGKVQSATYVLRSLYVLESDDQSSDI